MAAGLRYLFAVHVKKKDALGVQLKSKGARMYVLWFGMLGRANGVYCGCSRRRNSSKGLLVGSKVAGRVVVYAAHGNKITMQRVPRSIEDVKVYV